MGREAIIANNLRGFSNDQDGKEKWVTYSKTIQTSQNSQGFNTIFENETFKKCNFSSFTFKGIDFYSCYFTECNFTEATFIGCRLPPGGMKGVIFTNATFEGCKLISCNFSGVYLTGAKFIGGDCNGSVFSEVSDLKGAAFSSGIAMAKVDFSGLDLSGIVIDSKTITGANFDEVVFDDGFTFQGSNLSQSTFVESRLKKSSFLLCNMTDVDFTGADLSCATFEFKASNNMDFSKADLTNASFSSDFESEFVRFYFNDAFLSGATFYSMNMRRCVFSESTLVNTKIYCCTFNNCDFDRCAIDRLTLSSLEDQGVTRSDELVMNIVDDAATLRLHFGGMWSVLHVLAVLFFVTPYVWFVITHWPEAHFFVKAPENHISLWKALSLYIFNGGVNIQSGEYSLHWTFVLFVILFLLNVFRLLLLAKAKQLEHQEIVTGLPVRFVFSDPVSVFFSLTWGKFFKISKILIFVNAVLAAANFVYFMGRVIPLNTLCCNPF